MAPRVKKVAYDEDPDALYRGAPPRIAKVRAISATDRLLKPTASSLAASRQKALSGKDKERAEARALERKRRRLARVAKHNGRLTIPESPKFQKHAARSSRERPMLTMTSRELLEIAAIRKRVKAMRRKTQRYHEVTTHSIPNAMTATNDKFSAAMRSCGGLGVPAVRRAKLTTPVGFDFQIDKRAALHEKEGKTGMKRKSVAVMESSSTDHEASSLSSGGTTSPSRDAKRRKSAAP